MTVSLQPCMQKEESLFPEMSSAEENAGWGGAQGNQQSLLDVNEQEAVRHLREDSN